MSSFKFFLLLATALASPLHRNLPNPPPSSTRICLPSIPGASKDTAVNPLQSLPYQARELLRYIYISTGDISSISTLPSASTLTAPSAMTCPPSPGGNTTADGILRKNRDPVQFEFILLPNVQTYSPFVPGFPQKGEETNRTISALTDGSGSYFTSYVSDDDGTVVVERRYLLFDDSDKRSFLNGVMRLVRDNYNIVASLSSDSIPSSPSVHPPPPSPRPSAPLF